jgi:hypothetical protein
MSHGAAHAQSWVMGVSAHLAQGRYSAADAKQMVGLLGFGSIRDEAYWGRLEKIHGEFRTSRDFFAVDDIFQSARSQGAVPLLVLSYGNQLYGGGLPLTDEARRGFSRYAGFVLSRYKAAHPIVEIWNEWNAGMGGASPRKKGSAADYAVLTAEVIPVLRKSSPSSTVLIGATAGVDTKWTLDLMESDVWDKADGFSVHPYNYRHHRDRSPEFSIEMLDKLYASMVERAKALGRRVLPLYVTEMGWPTSASQYGVTEGQQADYAIRFAAMARTRAHIRGVWWYGLMDNGDSETDDEHRFGLFRRNMTAKPVAASLRSVSGCLMSEGKAWMDARDDGVITVTMPCSGGGGAVVLWRPQGPDASVDLQGFPEGVHYMGFRRGEPSGGYQTLRGITAGMTPQVFICKTCRFDANGQKMLPN